MEETKNGNQDENGNGNENKFEYIMEGENANTDLVLDEKGPLTASSFLSDIKIDLFSDYLYSYQKGKDTIVGIDSDGVRHIASDLGVSIESCDYVENEDYYEVKATAISGDGRKYFAVRRQQKMISTRDGKQYEDKDALAKAFTAAQRNALRGLVPDKMIKNLILKSMEFQKRSNEDIDYIKQQIRDMYAVNTQEFMDRSITFSMIFSEARIRKNSKDWDLSDWVELRNDMNKWHSNWIYEIGTDAEPGAFDGDADDE